MPNTQGTSPVTGGYEERTSEKVSIIGRSTAGSIISSAFDLPTPILDGNVKRILSRLLAIERKSIRDEKRLWEFSSLLISKVKPREFNQALMDLGAIICTPKNPICSSLQI